MKLKGVLLASAMALATVAGTTHAHAGNLLVNGSFETGDLTGWTNTGNLGYTSVVNFPYLGQAPEDGDYYVYEGPVGSDGLLSQTFSDVPGQVLTLSGWVIGDGTGASDVNFIFDGSTVLTVGSPVSQEVWTEYTAQVVGTGSDTFTVGFRNDPAYDGLDNFSVTPGVPEPATWAMMLIGLGGLGVALRSRRRPYGFAATA